MIDSGVVPALHLTPACRPTSAQVTTGSGHRPAATGEDQAGPIDYEMTLLVQVRLAVLDQGGESRFLGSWQFLL
jgi:hypothetical protein